MSYYIAPRFLDKLAVHITKNFLNLPNVKVPLILGIHGRKGEGKSFQCELVFKRMGLGVVYMSAGELESPDAGDSSRLVRLRYREAGEWSRTHGRMAVLLINDIDAGAGRVDDSTQYTVNTQLVNATLMNIADNPTNVQLPGSYNEEETRRIPIIVTGNDFGTLYAPLIRDGRMEKFYWEPSRDDRVGIVSGIFEVDAIAREDIVRLVDTFPDQSIDFYSALRARLYDEQVRDFIHTIGIDKVSMRVVNSTEAPPEFRKPNFSLPHLIEIGQQMVGEQRRIQEMRLAEVYNRNLGKRQEGEHVTLPTPPVYTPQNSSSQTSTPPSPGSNGQSSGSYSGQPSSTRLTPEVVREANQILSQGYRLGIEYVDERRFRTNAWNCFMVVQGEVSDAMAALDECLAEHGNDYIRLVGINPRDRRRVLETIVQRPNGRN